MSAPHLSTFAKLGPLAATQWGLITSKQATKVGVSAVILARWAEQGALTRIALGVYKVAGSPPDVRDGLRAAWLGLDPGRTAAERLAGAQVGALVSHWSAAAIHGLGDHLAEVHEFIVFGRRQTRRPEVRIHTRTEALDPGSWDCVDGLPVTSVPRTLADLASSGVDAGPLAELVRDALAAPSVDLTAVTAALGQHARRYDMPPGDGAALVQLLLEIAGPSSQQRARLHNQAEWLVATFPPDALRAAIAQLDSQQSVRSHYPNSDDE